MKRVVEPAKFATAPDFTPGALASWQDEAASAGCSPPHRKA